MQKVLIIFIGGGLGSISRYLLTKFVIQQFKAPFPLGTFTVNILGCLLIGIFVAYLEKTANLNPAWALLLTTGFCGGFTTFSTFSLENTLLLRNGDYLTFFAYTMLSVVIGLSAVFFGFFLIRKL